MGRQCRFEPTCSIYAREAVLLHGGIRGTGLALRRILRCHPWSPGGIDEVPPRSATQPSRPRNTGH
ncbi:MAG: membrane protein insertion efficiency factor YidD [Gammaproteobacteria bacterium]